MADKKFDDPEEPTDAILDLEEVVATAYNTLMRVFMAAGLAVTIIGVMSSPTTEDAGFTMGLVSFSGLNAMTAGPTVSPAFTLRVHVKNPSAVKPWCSNGGEVVVSYSGVALAWGHVPAFCVRRSSASEFRVLPWGWEVGLSEDLRLRLVSEWRMGKAQVSVQMRLFSPDCWTRKEVCGVESLRRFQPMLLTHVDRGQI